jgi:hypothetical protein
MKAVAVFPLTEAEMSPNHAGSPESIELGAWGTQLVPALRKYRHGPSLRQQGLKKLEHHRHQRSLMHPLGLRASGDLV